MKKFEMPIIEALKFDAEDVITTSAPAVCEDNNAGEDDNF